MYILIFRPFDILTFRHFDISTLLQKQMKKTPVIIGLLIFAAACMVTQSLSGQTQTGLDIDDIQVVAPYEPTISDAFKININPVIEDTVTIQMDFDYRIQPRKIVTRFVVEPISPARMRGEPLPKIYNGMVTGGFGSYQTPYLEGFYNTLRSNEYALGAHLRHISSGKEIDEYPHSVFSQNRVNLYGTRFFRNNSLDGNLLYNRQVVNYYGNWRLFENKSLPYFLPPTGTTFSRQRYELLSSALRFGSLHADSSQLNYYTRIGHNRLSDRFETAENHLHFSGNIGREAGKDPFGFARKQYLELDVSADHYFYSVGDNTINSGLYTFQPKMHAYVDIFRIHLGVLLAFQNEQSDFTLRTYPLAGVEADIIPGLMTMWLEASGGLEKQSWRTLSDINPFVKPGPVTDFTNVRSNIQLGLRGAVNPWMSYNIHIGSSRIDNHPFFVLNHFDWFLPHWHDSFRIVYDDIRRLHAGAEVSTRFGSRFALRLRGDLFDYILDEQEKAWHHPMYLITLNARYSLQEKIIFTADLFGRGKTYGLTLTPIDMHEFDWWGFEYTPYRMHDFVTDFNLGVEYRYTKRLSMFLNFSNITNEEYQQWLGYPRQGFNFMGGISYAF